MQNSKFEEFTKALATNSISRRAALKGIAASAVAGILAIGGVGNAFAHSKIDDAPASKTCPKGLHGCSQACVHKPTCDCVKTVSGTIICVHPMCTGIPCKKNSDCGTGSVCFTEGCCGTGSFCVPKC